MMGLSIIFGMKYFLESLTIHEPANKLIAKKCNQKINKKASLANIEYKLSNTTVQFKTTKNISF